MSIDKASFKIGTDPDVRTPRAEYAKSKTSNETLKSMQTMVLPKEPKPSWLQKCLKRKPGVK